jgi:hypothetical protein
MKDKLPWYQEEWVVPTKNKFIFTIRILGKDGVVARSMHFFDEDHRDAEVERLVEAGEKVERGRICMEDSFL